MRLRSLTLICLLPAGLYGQKRFSWQDLCFKNPALPVCQGNDYAVKPPPKPKAPTPAVVTNPFPSTPRSPVTRTAAPAVIAVGGIDWRFADPFADALIGFNVSALSGSPIARSLITMLGNKQGLEEARLQKIFDGLSDVDQVALSVRGDRAVAMITGRVADAELRAPEPGLKVMPVSGGAMLVGHADAVDQAMQRIAAKIPLSELARSAGERQASSEFWVIGSAGMIGPQAAAAGVKRFAMTVWIRDRLTTDATLEFIARPSASALRQWETQFGAAAIEGNALHARTSMEGAEVQQKFAQMIAGPSGQSLLALVAAAKYLPMRDHTAPKQTKPIIYGLDPPR